MACGACQFLKKKCEKGCVFAPYFPSENMDTEKFRAILKFFGASNFSKLLENVPQDQRGHVVATLSYEAAARIDNPIQGCLSKVFAFYTEIEKLKEERAVAYAELAACGSLDEASLSDVHSKQSQLPVLESNTNPYIQQQQQQHLPVNSIVRSSNRSSQVQQSQQLTFPGDLQSILPGNVAVSNYGAEAERGQQGSSSSSQWDMSSLGRSTAQQHQQHLPQFNSNRSSQVQQRKQLTFPGDLQSILPGNVAEAERGQQGSISSMQWDISSLGRSTDQQLQQHLPQFNSIVRSSNRSSQVQQRQQLTFPGDLQSILPGNVAEAERGQQGSSSSMQWDISSLGRSTAQQHQQHLPQFNSIVRSSNRSSQVQQRQQLTFPGDLQSILPGNVAEAERGQQGSSSSLQWDISSLGRSTAQQQMQMEMNHGHHFGHGAGPAGKWSHQKHPNDL